MEASLLEGGFQQFFSYRVVSTWGDAVAAGLPSYARGPDHAYVVPRRRLDSLLLERARGAGARVWEGVRALRACGRTDGSSPEVQARTLEGEDVRLHARVVVAADGSRGSFSRTLVPRNRLEPYLLGIRAYMEGAEGLAGALNFFLDRRVLPGYGWIFPGGSPGAPANVGLGMRLTALRSRREKMRALFDYFTGPESLAWPHLRGARLVSPPAIFPLLMDLPRGCRQTGAVLLAGDAANLIDPLTGEGVAYALESGFAAAACISGVLRSGRLADLAAYESDIRRNLHRDFLGAYLLRQMLVQPWGNGLMVRLLRRNEALARGGMGILANTVPPSWLLTRRVWGRMLAPGELRRTIHATRPAGG